MSKTTQEKKRGDDNMSTAISMAKDLHKRAIEICREDERTFSEYVRWLIRNDIMRRRGALK